MKPATLANLRCRAALPAMALLALAAAASAQVGPETDRLQFADGLFSRGMYALAIKEYEAVLKDYPQSGKADVAHFRMGECYRELKDPAAAQKQYKLVFDNYPASAYRMKAGFRRADLFMELNQYEPAIDLFGAVLREKPADDVASASLYFMATAMLKVGRASEAIAALEQVRTQYLSSEHCAYALLALGRLYGGVGPEAAKVEQNADKAAAFYKAAAAKPPTERVGAEALFQLAELYFRQNAFDKSAEAYRKLGASYPRDQRAADARPAAAWATHNAGLYTEALQMVNAQLTVMPVGGKSGRDEWLYLKANCERQLTKYAEAAQSYAQLLLEVPDSSFAHAARYERALTFYKAGNFAAVVAEAQKVELTDKLKKDIYWLMAESYAGLKDEDKAIQYYRLLVKESPDSDLSRDASYRLASHLKARKEYAEAARCYSQVATKYPTSDLAPSALFASAVCLSLDGKHEEAVRDWRLLTQKYPSSPMVEESMYQRAMSEIRLRRDQDAMASLRQLIRQYPKSHFTADAWYWEGMLQKEAQKWQDAESSLRQTLKCGPRPELARDAEFHLAGVLQKTGRTEEAAALYQGLVSSPLKTRFSPAMLEWLSEYQYEKKDFSGAAKAARLLADSASDGAWQQTGWGLLGRAQVAAGDKAAAGEAFKKALATGATTRFAAESALHLGESALVEKNAQTAQEYFQQAAAKAGDDSMLEVRAKAYAGLGRAAKAGGDFQNAARYFMSVAVLYDDAGVVPECMYEAAQAFKAAGKHDEAAKVLKELGERYPKSEWARRSAP